jgi:hypothetical protein
MSLVGRLLEHERPAKVATRYNYMELDALSEVCVAQLFVCGYCVSYEGYGRKNMDWFKVRD